MKINVLSRSEQTSVSNSKLQARGGKEIKTVDHGEKGNNAVIYRVSQKMYMTSIKRNLKLITSINNM